MLKKAFVLFLCGLFLCLSVISGGVVASAEECEHDFVNGWSLIEPASCTRPCVEYKCCAKDGCSEILEVILSPALGHSFSNGSCEVCGAILGDVNTDKKIDIRDLVEMKENLLDDSYTYDSLSDINIDGAVNADDMVALKKMLFAKF